ncbi:porin family protein [uncultured Arcticibacterium sp.]|uniref:porin family protein n=1 Tax=uncultured Arcticibacterium sp. TaxID=2173042 RepID=UPI0030F5AAF0
MKKLIAITITMVAFTSVSMAQFEIGARAGVNLSQVRGDGGGSDGEFWNSDETRSTGFTGGIYTRFGDKFFLQPEFIISQKGGTTTSLLGVERTFKQTYFDIPVLVGVKVGDVVRVQAGPVATFLVNKDDGFFENLGIQNNDDEFRKAILGYQLGVGFDIKRIRLDMRYEGNVNDVFNIDYDNQQTENQFAGKGNLWFLTLGYAF